MIKRVSQLEWAIVHIDETLRDINAGIATLRQDNREIRKAVFQGAMLAIFAVAATGMARNRSEQLGRGFFHNLSGNHDVMARLVRPWSSKPDSSLALRAHPTDEASTSEFHQGQRPAASIESPDLWLQSLPSYRHRLSA